jgi:hypothetical protein
MDLILKHRKELYLLISLYNSASYFYIKDYELSSSIIFGFTLFDTIYNKEINTKPDYLFHHILVLTCYGTLQYYKYYDFIDVTMEPLISFQTSSVFLSINELYKKNYYYNKYKIINLILFLSSFIYYRLYLYYYIIVNPRLYLFLDTYNKGLIVFPYCFILLNTYWIIGIIHKIIKFLM